MSRLQVPGKSDIERLEDGLGSPESIPRVVQLRQPINTLNSSSSAQNSSTSECKYENKASKANQPARRAQTIDMRVTINGKSTNLRVGKTKGHRRKSTHGGESKNHSRNRTLDIAAIFRNSIGLGKQRNTIGGDESAGRKSRSKRKNRHLRSPTASLVRYRNRSSKTNIPDDKFGSPPTRVMVSYCRRNQDFVRKLVKDIEAQRINVWVDWKQIPGGVDWWKEIEKGILNCSVFIFCLSPESIASEVCNQEVDYAVKCGKRLVPIVVKEGFKWDDVRPEIARINFIFFTGNNNYEERFKQLLSVIRVNPEHVNAHTELQRQAMDWEKNECAPEYLLRGAALACASHWLLDAQKTLANPEPTDLQCRFVMFAHLEEASARRKSIMLHHFMHFGGPVDSQHGNGSEIYSQHQIASTKDQDQKLGVQSYGNMRGFARSRPRLEHNQMESINENATALPKGSLFQIRGLILAVVGTEWYVWNLSGGIMLHILISTIVSILGCTEHGVLLTFLAMVSLVLSVTSFLELLLEICVYKLAVMNNVTFIMDLSVVSAQTVLGIFFFNGWTTPLATQLFSLALLRFIRIMGILNFMYKLMLGEKNQDAALLMETTGEAFRLRKIIKDLKFKNMALEKKSRALKGGDDPASLVTYPENLEALLKIRSQGLFSNFIWQEKFFVLDRRRSEKPLLTWHKSSAEAIINETEEGSIDMKMVETVTICSSNPKKILLTFFKEEGEEGGASIIGTGGGGGNTFEVMAKSALEARQWCDAIVNALKTMRGEKDSGKIRNKLAAPIESDEVRDQGPMTKDKQGVKINAAQEAIFRDSVTAFNPMGKSLDTIRNKLVPEEVKKIQDMKGQKMSKKETLSIIESMHSKNERRRAARDRAQTVLTLNSPGVGSIRMRAATANETLGGPITDSDAEIKGDNKPVRAHAASARAIGLVSPVARGRLGATVLKSEHLIHACLSEAEKESAADANNASLRADASHLAEEPEGGGSTHENNSEISPDLGPLSLRDMHDGSTGTAGTFVSVSTANTPTPGRPRKGLAPFLQRRFGGDQKWAKIKQKAELEQDRISEIKMMSLRAEMERAEDIPNPMAS